MFVDRFDKMQQNWIREKKIMGQKSYLSHPCGQQLRPIIKKPQSPLDHTNRIMNENYPHTNLKNIVKEDKLHPTHHIKMYKVSEIEKYLWNTTSPRVNSTSARVNSTSARVDSTSDSAIWGNCGNYFPNPDNLSIQDVMGAYMNSSALDRYVDQVCFENYVQEINKRYEEITNPRQDSLYVYGRTIYNSNFCKMRGLPSQTMSPAELHNYHKELNRSSSRNITSFWSKGHFYSSQLAYQAAIDKKAKEMDDLAGDLDLNEIMEEFHGFPPENIVLQERFFCRSISRAIVNYIEDSYSGMSADSQRVVKRLIRQKKTINIFDQLRLFGYSSILYPDESDCGIDVLEKIVTLAPEEKEQHLLEVRNNLAVNFVLNFSFCKRVIHACALHPAVFGRKRMPYTKMFGQTEIE